MNIQPSIKKQVLEELRNTRFPVNYPFRHRFKLKTIKITQTPYRLFLDDRISTCSYPDSMIKLNTLGFDTLKGYQINKMDLD
jgi:hypothetical protein